MVNDVVIAVLTFRRNAELRLLLRELVLQADSARLPSGILVVDNDPEGRAAGVVQGFGADVRYVHEERPGIAAARNKALEVSYLEQFLIFIDDDERPTDGWLDRLMACYFDSHPAAVVGPVISKFNAEPDQWVQAGDFFRRRRMPTGTSIKVAATNNLLLDLTQVRAWNLRFDEKFGISGGSDTLFSRSIVANGGVMVWCDEAVVIDQVPAARITRRWVLLRAFRSGNSWSRVSLHMERTVLKRLALRCRLTGAGLLRVAAGGSRTVWGVLVRSQVHEAKGLRTLSRGTGMVSGAYGYVYEEYRRNS